MLLSRRLKRRSSSFAAGSRPANRSIACATVAPWLSLSESITKSRLLRSVIGRASQTLAKVLGRHFGRASSLRGRLSITHG